MKRKKLLELEVMGRKVLSTFHSVNFPPPQSRQYPTHECDFIRRNNLPETKIRYGMDALFFQFMSKLVQRLAYVPLPIDSNTLMQ